MNQNERITLAECGENMVGLADAIGKELIDIEETIKMAVLTVFANPLGRYTHFLLEAPPGMGKTVLCKTIASWCNLRFGRIQLTPDMQPGEIVMGQELETVPGGIRTKQVYGPIFCNILLADEINRTPPRTQSSILQPMAECETTYAGRTYKLGHDMSCLVDEQGRELWDDRANRRFDELYASGGAWDREPDAPLFYVFATQNPVENEGTYRLPEAQLDRFLFKMELDYPREETIRSIVHAKSVVGQFCRTWYLDKGASSPAVAAVLGLDDTLREFKALDAKAGAVRTAAWEELLAGLRDGFVRELEGPLADYAGHDAERDLPLLRDEVEKLLFEKRKELRRAQKKSDMTPAKIIAMRNAIALGVGVDPLMHRYIARMLDTIRASDEFAMKVSPRCLETIVGAAKAHCLYRVTRQRAARAARIPGLRGDRLFITKEDVNACAANMLPHRVSLGYEAQAKGLTPRGQVERILRALATHKDFMGLD